MSAQKVEANKACRKPDRSTRLQLLTTFWDATGDWVMNWSFLTINLWSEVIPAGYTLTSEIVSSRRRKTWSKVPPRVWVGPTICCLQLKLVNKSSRWIVSLSFVFLTWIFMSPATICITRWFLDTKLQVELICYFWKPGRFISRTATVDEVLLNMKDMHSNVRAWVVALIFQYLSLELVTAAIKSPIIPTRTFMLARCFMQHETRRNTTLERRVRCRCVSVSKQTSRSRSTISLL